MLIPGGLFARDGRGASPQGCQPLSFSSSVCVGDLIAIIACSIAGIGFFFWAIHAIRKMRNDPFKDLYQEEPDHRVDPSAFDHSILAQHGVAQSPNYPDRVRTRLALSQPEEEFYRFTTPISIEAYTDQTPIDTPGALRRPPPAGGQSQSTRSHRSGRHGSLVRGGAYDERYGYVTQDDYIRDVGPSRARGLPPHEPGSGYGARRLTDPAMYHAY